MDTIYLDYNATSPLDARVAVAIQSAFAENYANPSSQHAAGRRASLRLEDEREAVASLLDAGPGDQVLFTSGATEANNLALFGFAGEPPGRIVISSVEHPSVAAPAEVLRNRGFEVAQVRVDQHGVIDLNHLVDLLQGDVRVVSVMLANHETGVVQPLSEVARICGERGVTLHTDAVQAIAKIPVSFRNLGVATLTSSGHKIYGPTGIGVLLLRAGTQPSPLVYGGFQQGGWRPGSEPIELIVGFRTALEIGLRDLDQESTRLAALRDHFERTLLQNNPRIVIHGHNVRRAPHTSNLAFPGLDRQTLLMALDMTGVACSTGSACASGSSEPSPVLRSMGVSDELLEGSLRFSLGRPTTQAEVDEAARRILLSENNLRSTQGRRKSDFSAPTRLSETL